MTKKQLEKLLKQQQDQLDLIERALANTQSPFQGEEYDDAGMPFATEQVKENRASINSTKTKGSIFQHDLPNGENDNGEKGDETPQTLMWNYQPATTDNSFQTEVWWEANCFVDKFWALSAIFIRERELLRTIRDNVFRGSYLFQSHALVRIPKQNLNPDIDKDGIVGKDDELLAKGDVVNATIEHDQEAPLYGQKQYDLGQMNSKLQYSMYDYIAVQVNSIDPLTKVMKCQKYQPWCSTSNFKDIPKFDKNTMMPINNNAIMEITEQDYIIMDLWYDNIGMYPKGLPLIQKWVYHKRMRDKNVSWLQVFCDISGTGPKPIWLTELKNFYIKDKSRSTTLNNPNNENKQGYYGGKIRWYAPEHIDEVFNMLNLTIAKDWEEFNQRFGFPIQAADFKQTLSTESSQYGATFQYIQQYILEGLYHFCRECKEKFGIDIDFYDVEEELHVQGSGNTNAVKTDTQTEFDKKQEGGSK